MNRNFQLKMKVKAFTILELSISMAISAIVILMTYTVFTILNKSYIGLNAKNQEFFMLLRADEVLKRDFSNAELILLTPKGIVLKKNNDEVINYDINKYEIIRISANRDTFKVNVKQRGYSFESSSVYKNISMNSNLITWDDHEQIQSSLIDELRLTIFFREELIPFSYRKTYSSLDLFNRKVHAIN